MGDPGGERRIVQAAGAEGLDLEAHRLRLADHVAQVDFAFVSETRRHDVLGRPARGVGADPVDPRRVLAAERAPLCRAYSP